MARITNTVRNASLLALAAGAAFTPAAEAQRFQWIYGTEASEYTCDIEHTFDGGYATAGSRDGIFSATGFDPADFHVVKTDPLGGPMWSVQFGGFARDAGHSLMPTRDGGYIVAGQTESTGSTLGLGLLRLDPFGSPLWAFTYTADVFFEIPNPMDPEDPPQVAVRETEDGDIIAVANLATGIPGAPGSTSATYVRTDAGGGLIVQMVYTLGFVNDDEFVVFTDIKELPDRSMVISGYVSGRQQSDPTTGGPGGGDVDALALRISPSGSLLWANRYFEITPDQISLNEEGYGLDVGPNGDFLVMSGVSDRSGGDLDGIHLWIDTMTGAVITTNSLKDFAPAWAATRIDWRSLDVSTAGEYPPAFFGGFSTGIGAAVAFDFAASPLWFNTYGPLTSTSRDRLEAVAPAFESCGWAYTGTKSLPLFGAIDIHNVKVNDLGDSKCFQDAHQPGFDEPRFRWLPVAFEQFTIQGQEEWGIFEDITLEAEPLCLDDRCDDPTAPCNPDVTTDGTNPGDPGYGVPDGSVTVADLTYFVEQWINGVVAVADVTTDGTNPGDPGYGVPDGLVTIADLTYYVEIYLNGCP
ncbi:MAG: GC-type dockerin domain-anchored protein [Planctomycetota bacterium]